MDKTNNHYKKASKMSSTKSELFDGNSTNYTSFEENFKTKLGTITEGVNAYEYVYEELWMQPEWTKIPKGEIPPSLDSATIVDHPDTGRPITETDRKERADRRMRMLKQNAIISKVEAAISEVLLECLGTSLKMHIGTTFQGDPIRAFKYIKETYGPEQNTPCTTGSMGRS